MLTPRLYLGTHQPDWLTRLEVPLMVSHRRLRRYRRRLPVARTPWVLDSGGFTELQLHGRWTIPPAAYATAARRYQTDIGRLEWAAPQDWMCEPIIINGGRIGPLRFAGTHLSIPEHQARTVANYLQLRDLAPEVPWIPVLQGWALDDYRRCLDAYHRAGVDLTAAPVVGLGSVCRRQATGEIEQIVRTLAGEGLRLHGFGVKTLGLARYADALASADSLAWSKDAFHSPPLPGCAHGNTGTGNCASCPRWALRWHTRITTALTRAPRQLSIDHPALWQGGTA